MGNFEIRCKGTHHPNHQVPHGTREFEHRETSHTPQDHLHIDHGPLVHAVFAVAALLVKGIQAGGTQNHGAKCEVAEYPGQHDSTTESLVVVCLLVFLGNDLNFLRRLDGEHLQLGFILRVQITVILRDVHIDLATWLQVGGRQLLGLVVTLGTPSDIVGVTEGVDVEHVDVGRGQEDVLDELEARSVIRLMKSM